MALANIAPQALLDLYDHHRQGKWREGAVLQQRLVPVNTAVTARFGVPGLKAALDMLGYYGGPVRSPLRTLKDAEHRALKGILERDGIL
jgi:4-hydroxy-2-oxoglutarate aldolase